MAETRYLDIHGYVTLDTLVCLGNDFY